MWQLWCNGATHTWVGTLSYQGYIFTSDDLSPLQFMVTEEGYKYVGGKGTIKMPDGTTVNLP
jgi:hypothetical protein